MSLLWRDEIGIFLGPGKVVLARMRRGIRPKCVAEQGISVDAAHSGDWRPAVDAMAQQLTNNLWHNANVRLVISDHWTRYAMLPWSPELARPAERIVHARMILNNKFGDISDDWTIAVSDNLPHTASIVSAIPTQLLDEIEMTLAAHSLPLVSLQPHLLIAYNSWRDRLPDSAAWFASIDEGSLAALHITNGRCDRVRSVRISDDWAAEMKRMQTIGRLAQDRPAEGQMFVDAPSWFRDSAGNGNEALEWLVEDRAPRNIADKVTLLKGMYA